MIRNYFISRKGVLIMAPVLLLLLASCGSYQQSGYENDGIYGDSGQRQADDRSQYAKQENNRIDNQNNNGNSYYKNLFAEKSAMYEQLANDAIFTDVDEYSSNRGYEDEMYEDEAMPYSGGHAPWGNDPDEYTVNIYNNGFYGGMYNPWRWGWANPYYGYGFGYGGFWGDPYWGGGYWGQPWGMGFHNYGPWGNRFGFGYGIGFGFGGFHSPFMYRHGYAQGYPYFSGRYFNHRDVAYNAGRRNAYSTYSGDNTRRTTNVSDSRARRSSYSRSIREIRNNRSSENTRRSTATRSSDNNRIYSRTDRRTESSRINSDNNRRNSIYNRSSNSSNRTYNRSSTPTRSSGTMRSSGSTRSSSGGTTRSSGGGRSGGRG